ncbi:hypothetical protein ABIB25_005327 [Nakamurella sp. UYEF19]|uniref:DUF4386 domain-containing protein n=1 Tax=Nakamurella sp. UYEF19 TaxID=1756392 RepID=UPI003391CE20
MTTTATAVTTPLTPRLPMSKLRRSSLAAGVLYLITFVSIPTLSLYRAARDPNFVLGSGPDSPVLVGGILELIVALAGIGTAVALYPVMKRQNQSLALGFVATRTLEAATIFAGVTSVLSVVSLRRAGAGTGAVDTARGLIAQHDWIFLLGQASLPAVNALLLGTLMYRSGLVPRILPIIGLIGAPILLASVTAKYFGLYTELSGWSLLGALPIAAWEFSLGVYLTFRGFRPSQITADAIASGDTK